MKVLAISMVLLLAACVHAGDRWKKVDEGFRMTIPQEWKKKKLRCVDGNCGAYLAKTVELHFDEVYGLGYTKENVQVIVDNLRRQEINPELLVKGEEIWHVGGRIGLFYIDQVAPKTWGESGFVNRAGMRIPHPEWAGTLSIFVLYKDDKDLPTIRRVFQSLDWSHHPIALHLESRQ